LEHRAREELAEQDDDEGIDLGLLPDKMEEMEIETSEHNEWIYEEGETKLAVENEDGLEEVRFIATADKTSTDDNNMSMVRAYQNNHIKNIPMHRFVNSKEKCEFDTYPVTCDDPCCKCVDEITSVPIYPVIDYDYKLNCYILSIFPTCGGVCATAFHISEAGACKGKRLQLQARFNREYFGLKGPIPFISQCARKKRFKQGYLDEEQWAQVAGRVGAVVKNPPFYFFETWIEETDIEKKNGSRNKNVIANHMIKATAEEQENYIINSERVIREFQSKRTSIENTKIGRRLGVKVRKS
jgi:hypothetical protein